MDILAIILCGACLIMVVAMLFMFKSISARLNRTEEKEERGATDLQPEQILREMEALQTANIEKILTRQEEQSHRQAELLNHQYETRLEAIQTRHEQQLASLKSLQEQQLAAMQARHEQNLAAMQSEYERRREADSKKSESEREALRKESEAHFQNLAANILKIQTDGLKQQNKEQIEAILRPLAENIAGFRKAVSDSYMEENASRKSLSDQIDRLMMLNESIGSEARNLTSALKGNAKVQGNWGEMILETMLENAGLEKGIHFETQMSRDEGGDVLKNEDGHRVQPDVVLNMPDARKLIIDSKVSLTAFTGYCAAETQEERAGFIREHLLSVKRHIDELAAKKYHTIVSGSADYVMMFIPNEGAYIAAVQHDPDLWQYAYSRHVAIVSPTHLFSSMRIVSQLWMQDKQNRNTLEIARKGGSLYDKVVLFMNAMQDIGNSLDKARDAYDTALSRLSTGRGNIARLSSDLQKLGAKATKTMPPAITNRMEADETMDEEASSLPIE